MYKVVTKRFLNDARTICLFEIEAPLVARHAQAGQFVIFRLDEQGERVPVSVAGYDREKGTVSVMVQAAGRTTKMLHTVEQGDTILDFVGPLGKATEMEGLKKVCVVGGGVGCAIAYPAAKKFAQSGAVVHSIIGFRNKELVILQKEFEEVSDKYVLVSDDGSTGKKGFVTDAIKNIDYDYFYTCGPLPMFKAVYNATETSGQFSFEERMGCGFGACMGCSCKTKYGNKRICKDGPVLVKEEIIW